MVRNPHNFAGRWNRKSGRTVLFSFFTLRRRIWFDTNRTQGGWRGAQTDFTELWVTGNRRHWRGTHGDGWMMKPRRWTQSWHQKKERWCGVVQEASHWSYTSFRLKKGTSTQYSSFWCFHSLVPSQLVSFLFSHFPLTKSLFHPMLLNIFLGLMLISSP